MESPSNETIIKGSRPRIRHRKGKATNMSVRLNPDFNLREVLHKENSSTPDANSKNAEIDPKTIDFEELVKLLHRSFISDYFYKILIFLKSEKRELSFPNLAPFKEAFLVKIVDNRERLQHQGYNEVTRCIGKQIIDVLNSYATDFKWSYGFDDDQHGQNVLVYRKIYVNDADNNVSPTPASISSSMEDLTLSTNQIVKPTFKVQILNTTLKFIEDNNRFCLEYPEMLNHQGDYVASLIQTYNKKPDRGRSLYSSLREAMKLCSDLYDFKLIYRETYNISTVRLLLQKIPKPDYRVERCEPKGEVKSTPSINSQSNTDQKHNNVSKAQKEILHKKTLINSLSSTFVTKSLQAVLDFVCDDTKATLEFREIFTKESEFLLILLSMSRRKDYYHLFPGPCVVMLKGICRGSSAGDWRLKVDAGKLNKRTKLRTITFCKEPYYDSGDSQITKRGLSKEVETLQITIDNDQMSPPATKRPDFPTTPVTTVRKSATGEPNAANIKSPVAKINNRSAGNDGRSSAVAFQSPNSCQSPSQTAEAYGPRAEAYRGLGPRKERLLEAMATKVQSEKAERIMRGMGWDGGALGIRGGIVEPIVPDLHLSAGAGLGHVKVYKRSQPEFRETLLRGVVSLLQGDRAEHKIKYIEPINKKEEGFTQSCVSALSARSLISVSRQKEKSLVTNAFRMLKDGNVDVEYSISSDRKEITLRKTQHQQKQDSKKKSVHQKVEPPVDIQPVTTKSIQPETTMSVQLKTTMSEIQSVCSTAKAAKALAQRVLFLEKIKEFLGVDDVEREYSFDFLLKRKHKIFIQNALTNYNRTSKTKYSTEMENDLYREIREFGDGCILQVFFGKHKFILTKLYYQKRFTNSDIEPLRSRDVKNTIIYTNDDSKTVEEETDNVCIKIKRENDLEYNGIVDLTINEDDDVINEEHAIVSINNDRGCIVEEVIDSDYLQDVSDCEDDLTLDLTDIDDDSVKEFQLDDLETKLKDKNGVVNSVTNDIALLDLLEAENCVDVPLVTSDSSQTEISKDVLSAEINNNDVDLDDVGLNDLSPSSKRSRSDSDVSNRACKKPKLKFMQHVRIIPENYPINQIDNNILIKVQKIIFDNIKETECLPLLQCHGINNGAIIYCCHNEKSLAWLKNVISVATNLNVTETEFREEKFYKFNVKKNSYDNVGEILEMLKLYNKDLDVDNWVVEGQTDSYFTVTVDAESYLYISSYKYSLFAGVDKACFSIVFD